MQKATWMMLTDLMEWGSMKNRCCWRKEITNELYLMALNRKADWSDAWTVPKFLLRFESEKYLEKVVRSVGMSFPDVSEGRDLCSGRGRMVREGSTC